MSSGKLLVFFLSCLLATTWAVFAPRDNGEANSYRVPSSTQRCPSMCYCSSQSLKCDFSQQDNGGNIEIPQNVKTLLFLNWPQETVERAVYHKLNDVRWLQLSKGRLISFPSVGALNSLSYIDVSDNQIQSLPNSSFSIDSPLTHLNVSGNQLTIVGETFFNGLTNLRVLDISRNPSLLQVSPNLFSSCCGHLRYLDLSWMGLAVVDSSFFDPLQQLLFLNVSHNGLSSIPEFHLPTLDIIDVSFNNLSKIPKLSGFNSLRELYSSHNPISYLTPSDIQGCNNLHKIDISNGNLSILHENTLSICPTLEQIDLSYNVYLKTIEPKAFLRLTNLSTLRLDYTLELLRMENDVFLGLTNLKELNLKGSGIKVLPTSIAKLPHNTSVNLQETTFLCDCNAHWYHYLLDTNISQWRGINSLHCHDGSTKTLKDLFVSVESLGCESVTSNTQSFQWVLAPWEQSALLECNVTGTPHPTIVWQTVDQQLLVSNKSAIDHLWFNQRIDRALSIAQTPEGGKYQVLQSGQLFIRGVRRADIGRYKCFAFNSVSNISVTTFLGLKDTEFRSLVLESMLFGFACAALFLFVTLLAQFIKFIMERLGWECCCCRDTLSPKAKQIRQLIESVESYKTAQLDRLKDNYNSQIVSIKDGCYSQMERIRDSYSQQSKNLKDLCDYSTQQITGARDQYLDQVNKCRDYSMGQMNRVRENYVFQRHKIRKFSGHQLIRLRDTYKYQQKTLNKLLETLPDLYIQNCRTGSCQRTDSMVFEDEIDGLDIYYKVDFLDTQSFNSSDYYTPSSTLTRQSKTNKASHSRNGSNVSGGTEYQDTHSWVPHHGSIPNDRLPSIHKRFHIRSLSLAIPAVITPSAAAVEGQTEKIVKGHKRSCSASSHPHLGSFYPKLPLMEEPQDSTPNTPTTISEYETPLYTTPITLTPVHDKLVQSAVLSKSESTLVGDIHVRLDKASSRSQPIDHVGQSTTSKEGQQPKSCDKDQKVDVNPIVSHETFM